MPCTPPTETPAAGGHCPGPRYVLRATTRSCPRGQVGLGRTLLTWYPTARGDTGQPTGDGDVAQPGRQPRSHIARPTRHSPASTGPTPHQENASRSFDEDCVPARTGPRLKRQGRHWAGVRAATCRDQSSPGGPSPFFHARLSGPWARPQSRSWRSLPRLAGSGQSPDSRVGFTASAGTVPVPKITSPDVVQLVAYGSAKRLMMPPRQRRGPGLVRCSGFGAGAGWVRGA